MSNAHSSSNSPSNSSTNSPTATIAATWNEFLAEYPFLSELQNVSDSGKGFTARCPAHDDDRNSLKISMAEGRHLLVFCHAKCHQNSIAKALHVRPIDLFANRYHEKKARDAAGESGFGSSSFKGNGKYKGGKGSKSGGGKPRGKVVATYDYVHPDDPPGSVRFQAVRLEPKDFRQRRPDPSLTLEEFLSTDDSVRWVWNLKDVEQVPYRLPELRDDLADDPNEIVFICEGEKDVDRLRTLELTATTNAGGAGKWRDEFSNHLKGCNVVLLQDNDEAGEKHVNHVARTLDGKAASIRILLLPGLPPKGDVSNWLDALIAADHETNTSATIRTRLLALASAAPQWSKPITFAPDDEPDDPHALAESFRYQFRGGEFATMVYYRDEFLVWRNGAYIPVPSTDLTALLNRHTRDVFVDLATKEAEFLASQNSTDRVKVRKVTRTLITNVLEAIRAQCLQSSEIETPFWFPDPAAGATTESSLIPTESATEPTDPFPANEILPTKNALVHIRSFIEGKQAPTEYSMDPTPRFFSRNCLLYNFDPFPPPPTAWLRFLASLWPDDPQSINTLQDWFGYCLMPDTRQQKMMLIVGPRRSGKGTIARTLTALLGSANVAGPTMSGLVERFGLWSLIGKLLAVIGDARISGRTDTTQIVERLLSISGEDNLTIDRKNLPPVTMRLPTRFMILSNEMPKLGDSSNALTSRFIVMNLTQSFYNREDKDLEEKILNELPSILLWAIEGWQNLQARGHFIQPDSSTESIEELEALSSPVGAFIKECCVVGPDCKVSKPVLFEEWKKWCQENGNRHSDESRFGRDLRSVLPFLKVFQPRAEQGRVRVWLGIGLIQKSPQDFQDSDSRQYTQSNNGFGTTDTTSEHPHNGQPVPPKTIASNVCYDDGTTGTTSSYLHDTCHVNKGNRGSGAVVPGPKSEVLI